MSYLPMLLPALDLLHANPQLVKGLRLVSESWATCDGAVLRHRFDLTDKLEYVAYLEVVFVRDLTNE